MTKNSSAAEYIMEVRRFNICICIYDLGFIKYDAMLALEHYEKINIRFTLAIAVEPTT